MTAGFRIALGQLSPVVGDVQGNLQRMRTVLEALPDVDLAVFPELYLTGYPPRDLLLRSDFIRRVEAAMEELETWRDVPPFVVGTISRNRAGRGRALYNSALLVADGARVTLQHKCLLPNYDVFDEDRYFEPGPLPQPLRFRGVNLGLSICEDIWSSVADLPIRHRRCPVEHMASQGLDLLVNISASPFTLNKYHSRERLARTHAEQHRLPVIMVNQVGGNDELIFDGGSFVIAKDGGLLARAAAFATDVVIVKPFGGQQACADYPQDEAERVYAALKLGLRDYTTRCGFERVVVGLSGGIDSAVTAALAVDALSPDQVTGLALPAPVSSAHSLADALQLGENLGITVEVLHLDTLVQAAGATLTPLYKPGSGGLAEENLQARLRGLLLMAHSNYSGSLLLSTGNKSELAVGYCTIYGDMCGGLAVLSDVYKTDVYRIARWINRDGIRIPQNSMDKRPSAELRPDQFDSDQLPEYDVLDRILVWYIEQGGDGGTPADCDAATVAQVLKLVERNEYKRRQAAPGLKVSERAFGVGWRMPLARKFTE